MGTTAEVFILSGTPNRNDRKRIDALNGLLKSGMLRAVEFESGHYHIRIGSDFGQYMGKWRGPQVDTFLFGVRLGQIYHELPWPPPLGVGRL